VAKRESFHQGSKACPVRPAHLTPCFSRSLPNPTPGGAHLLGGEIRYCFLLLEAELTAKPGSTQTKDCEAASLTSGVMDMLGAMVGLTGDASWQWSGSWLYAEVFSQPPATILKEAVEALVAVAQVRISLL